MAHLVLVAGCNRQLQVRRAEGGRTIDESDESPRLIPLPNTHPRYTFHKDRSEMRRDLKVVRSAQRPVA